MNYDLFSPRSFHESGSTLSVVERKKRTSSASAQEARVKTFFESQKDKSFTAEEIYALVFRDSEDINSARRSCTNLMNKGLIEKTEEKRVGKRYKRTLVTYKWK